MKTVQFAATGKPNEVKEQLAMAVTQENKVVGKIEFEFTHEQLDDLMTTVLEFGELVYG